MLKSSAIIVTVAAALAIATATAGLAHDAPKSGQPQFAAGEPGDPKKPARTIKVVMREDGLKMLFVPNKIMVRKGEQIRFVLDNDGLRNHEFMLATAKDNRKHAEEMKKNPEMEHDDPNAKRVPPYLRDELVWKFTKAGTFEFACLIPGHYEAGMHGTITVK